jgi:hypothetical protein
MKSRPILFSGAMVRALLAGTKTQTRRIVKPSAWVQDGDCDYTGACVRVADYIDHRRCPYGQAGDRLWVRETFAYARVSSDYETGGELNVWRWEKDIYGLFDPAHLTTDPRHGLAARLYYAADGEDELPAEFNMPHGNEVGWTPSIYMPRWASRITLEITEIRVQRLQEISEEDAKAEGATWTNNGRREWASHIATDQEADSVGGMQDGWSHEGETDPDRCLPSARGSFIHLWESINGARSWDANPWVWCISFRRVVP